MHRIKKIIVCGFCILIATAVVAATPVIKPSVWYNMDNIPNGRIKDTFEKLTPSAKSEALVQLNYFAIPTQDLEFIDLNDKGKIFYFDKKPASGSNQSAPSPKTSLNKQEVFALHSNPGASNVIFLDFDGHEISGSAWNESVKTYYAAPFDKDGSPSTYSQAEINDIAAIWHRVAEDFAAFDVDVTTEQPATFDSFTGRILITRDKDMKGKAMPRKGFAGLAYLGVWGKPDYTQYQPALVYYNNLSNGSAKYIAEAASHQMGHQLGLSHDGTSKKSAYEGKGGGYNRWAPIMGMAYDKHVTQWSNGDYPEANNPQDDVKVLSSMLGLRADDHGNNRSTASHLYIDSSGTVAASNPESDPDNLKPENKGVISTRGDVDMFELDSGTGQIKLTVTPAWLAYTDKSARGANLNIHLALLNASGQLVKVADPSDETSATIQYSAKPGTYFLSVKGVGSGDKNATFSDYGSLGQYFINGYVPPAKSVAANTSKSTSSKSDTGISSSGGNLQFIESDFMSYGTSHQDVSAKLTLANGGKTVSLKGNSWKTIAFPYKVTKNTVMEFSFSSSHKGEIHGIGFDIDKMLSEDRLFQLYGYQRWGIQKYHNYSGGNKFYRIPIGQYYQGDMKYLFIAMDHDVKSPQGESVFSNIRVYESGSPADDQDKPADKPNDKPDNSEPVDNTPPTNKQLIFKLNNFESFGGKSQDVSGKLALSAGGKTISMTGNSWKAMPFPYTITSKTMMEFSFSSSHQGEVHGIGFDTDKNLSENRIFQLYGSQRWGIQDFSNYTAGNGQKAYQIPVGKYFRGKMKYLVMVMDHDVKNPKGQSSFSNLRVYESDSQPDQSEPVPSNTAPVVNITLPAKAVSLEYGKSLTLKGVASDKEDGNVGAKIKWSSSIAGNLGMGSQLSVKLKEGKHTLTAMITDSKGKSAKATVTVTVTPKQNDNQGDNNSGNNGMVFSSGGFESFGGDSQDVNGTVKLSDGSQTISLTGNTWKAVLMPYTVTAKNHAGIQIQELPSGRGSRYRPGD